MSSRTRAPRRCFPAVVPTLLLAGTLAAQAPSDRPDFLMAKPAKTLITADHMKTEIGLKFAHGSGVRLQDGRFVRATPSDDLRAINEHLARTAVASAPLYAQDRRWLEQFTATGEARTGKTLHDLTLFFRLKFAQGTDPGALCDTLNTFDVVEIAWPFGRVEDPTAPLMAAGTPNFQSQQNYRERAPLGVDGDYGNRFSGGRGIGTLIADVETGWTYDHEDIINHALGNVIGLSGAPYPWDHGTAVLGELVGEDNGFGVLGLCVDATTVMSSHLGSGSNNPTAISAAAQALSPGDSLVIEVQCYNGPPSPHPCEYTPGVFSIIQAATANGIHVFAAAGNGNNNLDSSAYGGAFNRSVRDSGSVMVGASDGSSLNKASFSNLRFAHRLARLGLQRRHRRLRHAAVRAGDGGVHQLVQRHVERHADRHGGGRDPRRDPPRGVWLQPGPDHAPRSADAHRHGPGQRWSDRAATQRAGRDPRPRDSRDRGRGSVPAGRPAGDQLVRRSW